MTSMFQIVNITFDLNISFYKQAILNNACIERLVKTADRPCKGAQ